MAQQQLSQDQQNMAVWQQLMNSVGNGAAAAGGAVKDGASSLWDSLASMNAPGQRPAGNVPGYTPPQMAPDSPAGMNSLMAPWRPEQAAPPPSLLTQAGLNSAATTTPPPAAAQAAAAAMPAAASRAATTGDTSGLDSAASTAGLLDSRSIDALQAQGLTVADIQKRLSDLQNKPLPKNYSAIASLVDSWTGGHLAQAAAGTETAQDRQAAISKLQDAVLKGQQGMSQDEISMLKDKLQAQFHEQEMSQRSDDRQAQREQTAAIREQTQGYQQGKFQEERFDKATKSLQGDPAYSDAMKKADEVNTMRDQIKAAATNPIAWQTLPMSTVRLFVNRVSAPELAQATGEKDIPGRLSQIESSLAKGTITPDNAKFMNDLVDHISQSTNANLQSHIERHTTNLVKAPGSAFANADFAQTADALSGGQYSRVKAPTAAPATAAPKAGDLVDGYKFKGGNPADQTSWEKQ